MKFFCFFFIYKMILCFWILLLILIFLLIKQGGLKEKKYYICSGGKETLNKHQLNCYKYYLLSLFVQKNKEFQKFINDCFVIDDFYFLSEMPELEENYLKIKAEYYDLIDKDKVLLLKNIKDNELGEFKLLVEQTYDFYKYFEPWMEKHFINLAEVQDCLKYTKYRIESLENLKKYTEYRKIIKKYVEDLEKSDIFSKNLYWNTKPEGKIYCEIPFKINKRKITENEAFQINLYYKAIYNMVGGNQYSLRPNFDEIEKLGFKVEVFGSSLNVSLPYFGSLSKIDEPCGRLGRYEEILDTLIENKDLCWRDKIVIAKNSEVNLCINPPSGSQLHKNLLERLAKLFEKRKFRIYLDLPIMGINGKRKYFEKYIKKEKQTFDAYYLGKKIRLKDGWIMFYLTNIEENYNKYLSF